MLKNLKSLRHSRNLTQKGLSKILNISQQTIDKYENRDCNPRIATIIKIADYFDTSVDYLLGRTNDPRSISKIYPADLSADEISLLEDLRNLSDEETEFFMKAVRGLIT